MANIPKKLDFEEKNPEPTEPMESEREQLPKAANQKKSYEQMMIEAIGENDQRRKGVSFAKIKQFIQNKYDHEGKLGVYLKKAFEKLTAKNVVEQVKGVGMTGSIRFTKKYVEDEKKKQQLAERAEKKEEKAKAKAEAKKEQKDKNNNDKKQKSKKTEKVKKTKAGPPQLQAKLNPKKTAITKTKIDRSNGKVRLSIGVSPNPGPSKPSKASKAKANGKKKEAAGKSQSEKAKKAKKQ